MNVMRQRICSSNFSQECSTQLGPLGHGPVQEGSAGTGTGRISTAGSGAYWCLQGKNIVITF